MRFFQVEAVLCSALVLLFAASPAKPAADDLQKSQKKELEAAAKALNEEGKNLEKAGQLVDARQKYAQSLGYIESGDATSAISRIDGQLKDQVKAAVANAQKAFDAGKYPEAAHALEDTLPLQTLQPLLAFNLALCYQRLGDRQKARDYLDRAIAGSGAPKLRAQLNQLRTALTTAEVPAAQSDAAKKQLQLFNHLAETLGNGSSTEDELGDEEVLLEDVPDATAAMRAAAPRFSITDPVTSGKPGRFSSACTALQAAKDAAANSPAAVYDAANCAEENNRPDEATRLLHRYLELSPNALDAPRVTRRMGELELLKALQNQSAIQVRALYASADRFTEEHQYDGALIAYRKAADILPDFALTHWKLGLLLEAMGNIADARKEYTRYRDLDASPEDQQRADFRLSALDPKREKYDDELSQAEDILADLWNRAMNLTFNGLEDRSALRPHRPKAKGKGNAARRLGGFTVPAAYAQQQIGEAAQHLQAALTLFPLAAEANELMALVYLQALDGRAAIHSYDAVASQNLPVSFYAEVRGHNLDRPAKCELSRDLIRFIFLGSYDSKGMAKPPARQAGQDGLGDLVLEPGVSRGLNFEDFAFRLADIKKVETKDAQIFFRLEHDTYSISPLAIAFAAPKEPGPFARRFSNDYTRLFVRYPGLEDTKLGAEGMTGYEKFRMGMDLANAGFAMAMGGPAAAAAIQDAITVIQKARMLQRMLSSLKVSFATWETAVEEDQDTLIGNPFKPIPAEPLRLAYLHDLK